MAQPSWVLLALVGAALIYEASAINCVKCNDEAEDCIDGSKPTVACTGTPPSDKCYMMIVESKLTRGCESELIEAQKTKCNDPNDLTCHICTGEGCNKDRWLKCHSCASGEATCTNAQTTGSAYCNNYKAADACFARFNALSQIERGCQSDAAAANACQDNVECKTCTTDGCNSEASSVFATQCVQCSTSSDADGTCLKGSKATTACAKTSGGKCFSKLTTTDGVLQRGCQGDLTPTEVTACTGSNCNICTANGCNKEKFPADRAECYQCDNSGTDKSCADALEGEAKSAHCKTYKAGDQCYSRLQGTVFERGCQADLPDNANACQGSTVCSRCTGVNCNKVSQEVLTKETKCQRCSSANDALCLAGTSPSESCEMENDKCITRVNGNNLERDCLSKLIPADQAKCNQADDPTCVICEASDCNSQKWLQCHQCTETETDKACANAQTAAATFCQHLKQDDKCYEQLLSAKADRGCVSSLTTEACQNNLECRTCSGDGCNKEAATTLQTKDRCLQCLTSSDADGKCLAGTEQSQPCLSVSNEKCYSKVNNDGVLQRGCHGELSPEDANACSGDTCTICTNTGCNTGIFPTKRLSCYQCKGDTDKDCLAALTGDTKASYCKTYFANDKCYSRIVNEVFERGCQSNLGKDVDACKDLTDRQCQSCDKENCNGISEERLKNSAGKLALGTLPAMLVTVITVLAVKMF